MNLYDYSKQVISAEVPMDSITFHRKIKEISESLLPNNYYMFLCHERRDYTIIKVGEKVQDTAALRDMIMNRGLVLVIDKQKDGNYEIWLRDFHTDENFAYYLFNYTDGVMEV